MKQLLLFLACYSTASALTINFSKDFDIEIKPDTLQASVNINVKKSLQSETVNALGRIAGFIDSDKDIEKKGGNYSVYPSYKYENNHRYKDGYAGNMSYIISSNDSDKLNNFLTSLYGVKHGDGEEISLNSIVWVMSKEQKSGKIDMLRLQAIKWATAYAIDISKDISSNCKVKSISFTPINFYQPQPVMRDLAMAEAKSAPTPTQDIQKITVSPTIQLECK